MTGYRRDPDGRVLRDNDDTTVSSIPDDTRNTDYATYLAWKAGGGDPGPIPPRPPPAVEDTNRASILDQMRTAWTDLGTYLALGALSTAAQDKAALRLVIRCVRGLIRVAIGKLDGTD